MATPYFNKYNTLTRCVCCALVAGIMHYYMLMHIVLTTTLKAAFVHQGLYFAKQTLVKETPKNATNHLRQPRAPKSLASFQKVHTCRRKTLEPGYTLGLSWPPSLHHLSRACNPCTRLISCIYASSCPTAIELITARTLYSYLSLKPTYVQTLCFLSV